MSERKVLNKYYPPDFDPAKIPKLKLPKDRQYVVRLMAPFNMRCKTCGEYIYKGKKFNARKETVLTENYLGLHIFRFYIKCTRCVAEITFKTDPENTDYAIEHGATRNFQAEKLIEEEEQRIVKEREEEELNNPMKVLENRTKDSKWEMDILENLEELKDLNQRQATVDFEGMLARHTALEELARQKQLEQEEREIQEIMNERKGKRLIDSDSDSAEEDEPGRARLSSSAAPMRPTDILTQGEEDQPAEKKRKTETWERSVGSIGQAGLKGLVVRKPAAKGAATTTAAAAATALAATETLAGKQQSGTHRAAAAVLRPVAPAAAAAAAGSSGAGPLMTAAPAGGASGLSLLGAYSDSSGGGSSSEED
ncbi:LOW QUALITY PROTEIN: splicing factor YJU2-like [Lethenteron reissneri]|uniref:LOW QUALITY PROTEIN: splicing factor YJU2-like n=1 Tax=Lethenteron reissneri TaxID=7753 RepID=UPI002AB7D894|nr:LOW QUALITY PROTEIN: splicing factor YJU2-like [Lethenteron reissneri]